MEAQYSAAVGAQQVQGPQAAGGQQGALQALLYGQTVMHSSWVMDGVALVARCALPSQHH